MTVTFRFIFVQVAARGAQTDRQTTQADQPYRHNAATDYVWPVIHRSCGPLKPSIHRTSFGNFVFETRTVVERREKVSETFILLYT